MPTRHGGLLANRASTCPRDHFCRSTIAPLPSRPTTWNVFLPISIPITALTPLRSSAMGVLLSLNASCQLIADSAGARPDHPISDHAFEVRLLLTVPPVRAIEARTVPSTAPAAAERP